MPSRTRVPASAPDADADADADTAAVTAPVPNGPVLRPGPGPKRPSAVGKAPISPGDPEPGAGTSLALPHERDESPGQTAPTPDPVMLQAKKDLDAGLVDTDLHNAPGQDAERREELLREERTSSIAAGVRAGRSKGP